MTPFVTFAALGLLSGLLSGLFGIGGGLVIVPVLIYTFTLQGLPPDILTHLAVGTSLATIVFTSINSVLAHHRHGAVRWKLVTWMTLGIIAGSAAGAVTASMITGPLLQKIIGIFAILMACQMAFELKPRSTDQTQSPNRYSLSLAGGVIGWASAIFGIGGGSLTVPYLHWKGISMKEAVATSAAAGLPISISASASFIWVGLGDASLPQWSIGFVYIPALIGIVCTSMLSARAGARLAHKLDPRLLKRLFALLLLTVGLNFLL
ncbi:sulfite exporter TauE/SafE family protein [Marinobacterium lacunae]|nr:sulfite exporter TauE/SafE family protein [Marinobacterium lacunae]